MPEYTKALDKSTLEAPSAHVLRRMGSPLSGYEIYLEQGPAGPAWETVDLIDASFTGATPSLNINGWMDIGAFETVKLFEFQQHHPEQYLIMAPSVALQDADDRARCQDSATGRVGDSRFPYRRRPHLLVRPVPAG